ncbi:MAG: HAMP domain-containing histidine kinase, partial [Clostridiales bacterium]|nr:HAMP domain-containing histidine kinase [Clostridiales bacterium]
PDYKAVDLKCLTEDIIDRSKELLRERNITISFNRDEKPYTVYADPDMMNIVISNFMSNAVKYCDHIIMIRLVRNGRKIEFSMTNDGAKIEKDELDKVWDVFYTTDKARTDRVSSSGVGLSVVKSILDAHKADYGCTSGDNGTEFNFSLPSYGPA